MAPWYRQDGRPAILGAIGVDREASELCEAVFQRIELRSEKQLVDEGTGAGGPFRGTQEQGYTTSANGRFQRGFTSHGGNFQRPTLPRLEPRQGSWTLYLE
jgi:hypothetical protein